MTFTAIVWSKKQFVTWRCAACLLSRKNCSVMKKINSTNNAEQPRPPALNRWVALSAFGDRRELLHEGAKPRPHVVCFSFDQPIVASGSRLSYARILLFPASTQYPAGSPITALVTRQSSQATIDCLLLVCSFSPRKYKSILRGI